MDGRFHIVAEPWGTLAYEVTTTYIQVTVPD